MTRTSGTNADLDKHLAALLERVGEVARALRWQQASDTDLTPLQLRIMGFIADHPDEGIGVARLADELQIKRPTISESVTLLVDKGMLLRMADPRDGRSHALRVTAKARRMMRGPAPLDDTMADLAPATKEQLLLGLMHVLHGLSTEGKLQVQRMCWTCKHYKGDRKARHACLLLERKLAIAELRTDCPEHVNS
ncbi:MAG: MarR family transcriptional regulator [Flavobacteriales bacterium]|nr:MarR family transcriptional regulator [Flavobacteriales bacterium]